MYSVDALPERLRIRTVVNDDGCWNWTGKATTKGYGMVKRERSRSSVMVYRLAYELLVAPIPQGMVIDHLCRNPRCLNPAHLEPVSQKVNVHRGNSAVVEQASRTQCPQGHPLSGDNLYIQLRRGIQHRSCLACRHERNARR